MAAVIAEPRMTADGAVDEEGSSKDGSNGSFFVLGYLPKANEDLL